MLITSDNGTKHLAAVKEFAAKVGKAADLDKQLEYLDTYAEQGERGRSICSLYPDHGVFGESKYAGPDFGFVLFTRKKDKPGLTTLDGLSEDQVDRVLRSDYEQWFNGGCLFHGKHDGFGSGSGPTFAVTLGATDGWSIHT